MNTQVTDLHIVSNWHEVVNAARITIHKPPTGKEPSQAWKYRMLLAEHSPIRELKLTWTWQDLSYWVSVQFVRHKIGIEHYVSTSRSDRVQYKDKIYLKLLQLVHNMAGHTFKNIRSYLPQGRSVTHRCTANAQEILAISRKRLCKQASTETRVAWMKVLQKIKTIEPELYGVCVPNCIYRGYCYEMNPCGYTNTVGFGADLECYRKLMK